MYEFFSRFSYSLSEPFLNVFYSVESFPLIAAFVLGLVGALAPCQFTGNLGAITLYGNRSLQQSIPYKAAIFFTLGKIAVFSSLGFLVWLLGHEFQQSLTQYFSWVRKGIGPLLILIGLFMIGMIKMRWTFSIGKIPERLFKQGNFGAFLMGTRQIPFSREIYIEQDDFMEDPPKKYFRLFPGNEVRLKHAYFIKCEDVIKDEQGNVVEIHCTYDPETKSGTGFTGRKVKGTLHWVEATQAVPAEFRLYEPLLLNEENEEVGEESQNEVVAEKTFLDYINPNSLEILKGFVEPNLKGIKPQEKLQFFRHGYFNVDPKHTTDDQLVFNLIVSLKSSFKL